jgi:hypothetical protein
MKGENGIIDSTKHTNTTPSLFITPSEGLFASYPRISIGQSCEARSQPSVPRLQYIHPRATLIAVCFYLQPSSFRSRGGRTGRSFLYIEVIHTKQKRQKQSIPHKRLFASLLAYGVLVLVFHPYLTRPFPSLLSVMSKEIATKVQASYSLEILQFYAHFHLFPICLP